jgi:hypothetical protein
MFDSLMSGAKCARFTACRIARPFTNHSASPIPRLSVSMPSAGASPASVWITAQQPASLAAFLSASAPTQPPRLRR